MPENQSLVSNKFRVYILFSKWGDSYIRLYKENVKDDIDLKKLNVFISNYNQESLMKRLKALWQKGYVLNIIIIEEYHDFSLPTSKIESITLKNRKGDKIAINKKQEILIKNIFDKCR